MVKIDRAVITIFNLSEQESVKEVIKKAVCEIPCLGIGPDWVFFQFPTYSKFKDKDVVVRVFLESMDNDEIDFLMRDTLERTLYSVLEPLTVGHFLKVEAIVCETALDSPCLGL